MLAQIHHQFRIVLLSIAEKGTLDFGLGYSRLAENKALKGGGTYCFRFQSSALIHSCAVNVFPIFFTFRFPTLWKHICLQLLPLGAKSWWNHSSHEINASESMRFRNSRLTMLLRDSLGGDSKTLMSWQPSETPGVSFLLEVEKSSDSRREKSGQVTGGKKRKMCCFFVPDMIILCVSRCLAFISQKFREAPT